MSVVFKIVEDYQSSKKLIQFLYFTENHDLEFSQIYTKLVSYSSFSKTVFAPTYTDTKT